MDGAFLYKLIRSLLDSRVGGRLNPDQRSMLIRAALDSTSSDRVVMRNAKVAGHAGAMIRLVALGDLALLPGVGGAAPNAERVSALVPFTEGADLVTANFEAVVAGPDDIQAGTMGSFLKIERATLELLDGIALRAATVANNHAMDFGAAAHSRTRQLLHEMGIRTVGGASEDAEVVFTREDLSIAMLGACDDVVLAADGTIPLEILDDVRMGTRIRAAAAAGHHVVVHIHWGFEWMPVPMRTMRDRARAFVDEGASIVLCHHAHVPMGIELYGRGAIAHGLGNAFFPFTSKPAHYLRDGVPVLSFILGKAGVREVSVDWLWHDQTLGLKVPDSATLRALNGFQHRANAALKDTSRLDMVEKSRYARFLNAQEQWARRCPSERWSLPISIKCRIDNVSSTSRPIGT